MNSAFTFHYDPLQTLRHEAAIAIPACGTSRKTLAILEETPGVDVEVINI